MQKFISETWRLPLQWQSVLREEIQFDGFQNTGIASFLEDSFHGCLAGQPLFTLSTSMSRKLFPVSKALESFQRSPGCLVVKASL